jgi:hypothetical protein
MTSNESTFRISSFCNKNVNPSKDNWIACGSGVVGSDYR